MLCQNCGQQTEEGKFCTKCGAKLNQEEAATTQDATDDGIIQSEPIDNRKQEQTDSDSASSEPSPAETAPVQPPSSPNQQQSSQSPPQVKPNETVERIKTFSARFGDFFLPILKRPSHARNVSAKQTPSGIVTLVIFSLIIALGTYLMLRSLDPFLYELTFVDHFLIPALQFLVLFAAMATVSFFGVKMTSGEGSYATVFTKYSAYTVPFLLVYIAGIIFELIKFPSAAALFILISMLGVIFAIPTFILFERHENGFDRVYVLIGIYIVGLLIFGLLGESVLNMMSGHIFSDLDFDFDF
ncbi:MAG TPA: zinc ribbon domain-containing protein [Bacillota bacterium]|nr:zinc ribbon domain-containing protein [Bacillota bacterium]